MTKANAFIKNIIVSRIMISLLIATVFLIAFMLGILTTFQDSLSWHSGEPVLINDDFDEHQPSWTKWLIGDADYELLHEEGIDFLRLQVNSAVAGQVALAQLDDYAYRPRLDNRWHPRTSITVRMRYSRNNFSGTSGFYLWNNPAPIGASAFTEYRGLVWMGYQLISPTGRLDFGNGSFIRRATVINQSTSEMLAMSAGLSGFEFEADEVDLVDLDMTEWHDYRIDWYPDRIILSIDDEIVLDSPETIEGPLSLVLWMDNTEILLSSDGYDVFNQALDTPVWLDVDYIRSELN